MKQKRGAGMLLILCEAVVLILVLALGIFHTFADPKKEKTTTDTELQEDNLFEITAETEAVETTTTEESLQSEEPEESFSEEILAKVSDMTLEQKVAHLFLTTPESLTQNDRVTIAGEGTRSALEKYPVAGLVYTRNSFQGRNQFGALISGAQRYSYETNAEYLLLTSTQANDSGKLMISGVYDAGAMLELIAADTIQGNEDKITFLNPDSENPEGIPVYQYQGVTIAGDLSDAAVSDTYPDGDAAMKALQAGADLLLVTDNFTATYDAVLAAISDSGLSEEALDQKVCRILTLKASMPQPTDGDIISVDQTADDQQADQTNQAAVQNTNQVQADQPQADAGQQSNNQQQADTGQQNNNQQQADAGQQSNNQPQADTGQQNNNQQIDNN